MSARSGFVATSTLLSSVLLACTGGGSSSDGGAAVAATKARFVKMMDTMDVKGPICTDEVPETAVLVGWLTALQAAGRPTSPAGDPNWEFDCSGSETEAAWSFARYEEHQKDYVKTLDAAPMTIIVKVDSWEPGGSAGFKEFKPASLEARAVRFGRDGGVLCVEPLAVKSSDKVFAEVGPHVPVASDEAVKKALLEDLKLKFDFAVPKVKRDQRVH